MWTGRLDMALSLQRLVLQDSHEKSDLVQLNIVAKAVFGVASVTFEVCAHRRGIRRKNNAWRLAPEGTKQV